MNYLQFVNTVLDTSKSHKLVYEVGEGDIYEHLNSGDHKYPCVFLTVQNVDSNEGSVNGPQMTVTGSLFYVDALLSDTSNKLQIQSTGMTTLHQIFMRLMDNYPDFELRTGRYTPFDEKFSDLCAGVFSNFTISFMDDTCIVNDDIFEGDIPTPPTPPTPPEPPTPPTPPTPPEPPTPPTPEGKYMTITVDDSVEGEAVIKPTVTGTLSPNLQYRINSNGDWSDFIVGTTADIHLVAGDFVQWKGNNTDGVSTSENDYLNFAISGNAVALSGNIMSLIDGVGNALEIPNDYCFYRLFHDSSIKTVSPDFLPATTLTNGCYFDLFSNSILENAPELPATTLSTYCYRSMFKGCTALETAPELPATTLTEHCYESMFNGCTALTQAPELPATTLANSCYQSMFYYCTSLTQAPELSATQLVDNCYYGMFGECKSLTTAPALPATTLANLCYSNMFNGCTALTQAPELPATTLMYHCYTGMFYRCTALTTAPELPATTLANYCYQSMFCGCTALTTAPELPATQLVDNCYAYMFKNCNNLNYMKCIATDITATDALTDWLSGVAASGTFVKEYGVEYLIDSPSGIPQGWTVEEIDVPIPPEPPTPIEPKYMTITADKSNSGATIISPTVTGSLPNLNLQYRVNGGDWNDFIVGTTADIHLVAGDFVQWKGNNPDGVSVNSRNYLKFAISGNAVALSGNIMSLIDGVGNALEIPNDDCFNYMFAGSNVKTVSSDFLPATTLAVGCYLSMFSYCSSLTTAPALPATTLANSCYQSMFSYCSSLTTAPALPATTLANMCYESMFQGCESLTTAPEILPATTLAYGCYGYMFSGCTSLTTAPELSATTLANYCCQFMFIGCTSLTTAPALNATTLAFYCYFSMFAGCESLTTAPVLPATTLAEGCYQGMFYGCTALTTAPDLPATTLAYGCYSQMFSGCTSLTTAPELPATTLAPACYVFMFDRCKKLNYVKCLATDITETDALSDWLFGVAASGTFVKKYGVEYLIDSPSGIPSGWTVEEIDVPIPPEPPTPPTPPEPPTPPTPPEPEGKYMTITADKSNSGATIIHPKVEGSLPNLNLQYRINNGDWKSFKVGTTADIHLGAGDFVQWKGNNPDGVSTSYLNYLNFAISNLCHLSGNVMSLIDGVGETLVIPNDYCFYYLFFKSNVNNVKTVSSDFLPATTLARSCYDGMFKHCSKLVSAPALPATTLADNCYYGMFKGCSKLVSAPALPATTLADKCYQEMFWGCTSLTTAPEILPATTLAVGCYLSMFWECTVLKTAPELPATTLANNCYANMFWECTLLTTAPDLPATTLAYGCYSQMFSGCTSLTTAPVLPATKLAPDCYMFMFDRCKKLNYVKCLAKGFATDALYQWLSGVASIGTFVRPSGVYYERGISGIPLNWTIQNI